MKRILLAAGSHGTAAALRAQLAEYLEGRLEIGVIWTDEAGAFDPLPDCELLLVSSSLVLSELEAAGLLRPELSVLVARRSVDPGRLEELVALETGRKILFVNDRPETAGECVDSLLSLGLDYVDWLPWHPGLPPPPPEYQTAVVAGEPSLVPASVPEIIDIGPRIFDFGTLAELFRRLDLPEAEVGRFSRRYLSKIVSLTRSLAKATEEAKKVSGHLGSVIEGLGHGILVYDGEGRVSVCNEEARSLLSLKRGELAGTLLPAILRNRELLEFLEGAEGPGEASVTLPEGCVLVKRLALGAGGHTLATLRREEDCAAEDSRRSKEYRRRGHVAKWTMEDIVGEGEALRKAKRIARRLAATDLSILINGESGTGKELFASAIHAASARRNGPFLAVDLGALSDDLIESELFGYEEGAFTGAKKGGKAGLFELADGGSLFLDEIGNISAKVQKRLLRVLQEKEILRVGGTEIIRVDVRVIAATNEDLYARAERGEFREDLFFRLKMGWLRIPPLRERREDIPLLMERFLAQEGARQRVFEPELVEALARRDWPGNVRELRNTLTYLLAVAEGARIGLSDLPEDEPFEESGPGLAASGERGGEGAGGMNRQANPFGLPGFSDPVAGSAAAFAAAAASAGFRGAALFALGLDGVAGLVTEDRLVLLALAELESRGHSAGRDAVAEALSARGLAFGSGAVRTRLERLSALGLVSRSRGRRGARLTQEGRRLLAASDAQGRRF